MRKVGVTGVGFIGLWVVEELINKGYEVVAFDHHIKPDDHYPKGVEKFYGDIRDATAVTEFVAHVDGVIHLAACLGTQETIKNPYPAAETNVLGGINILEACAQYDIPLSYIAVGNHHMNNTYSISKTAVERFVDMYNSYRGTRINVVRAMNAYGPRQLAAEPYAHGKVRKITPAFICRALTQTPIEVYGDGEQVSDMVWVGDVAKALVIALEKASVGVVFKEVVEVGPEDNKTVNEVADVVATIASEFTGDKVPVKHLPMRPGELAGSRVVADVNTLRLVDMTPEELVPLEEGMRKTVQYFVETEGKAWHK